MDSSASGNEATALKKGSTKEIIKRAISRNRLLCFSKTINPLIGTWTAAFIKEKKSPHSLKLSIAGWSLVISRHVATRVDHGHLVGWKPSISVLHDNACFSWFCCEYSGLICNKILFWYAAPWGVICSHFAICNLWSYYLGGADRIHLWVTLD